jgi:hypothetical protein
MGFESSLKRFILFFNYSKRYDFVPLPLPFRYSYNVTVIDRRPPLHTVTDRFPPLPNVKSFTKRYRTLQALHALQALQSVTYFILQKTLNELF